MISSRTLLPGLLFLVAITAIGKEKYHSSVPKPTLSEVSYGPHERHALDFWKAESASPTPLVFVIHGGGWSGGSKERLNRFADAPALLAEGISVVAINYRLMKHSQDVVPPVKAPLHDAARALQFVRSKAKEWNIDKTRIGAAGGSAGACSSLWLAFHDDMADPDSDDPVARESTRLACAAVGGAQTTLDPKQMKAWTPNSRYGGHAFGKKNFAAFLAARDDILPWIAEYSPYALVTADDPPVYLNYKAPPAIGKPQKDPTHSANFGVKLQEHCRALGVACELVYPGAPNTTAKSPTEYLIKTLKRATPMKLTALFAAALLLTLNATAETQIGEANKRLPLPGESFSVNGHTAFVIMPEGADKDVPWVWYAPTLGGLPGNAESWMFKQFLAKGIAIAGIDVGESYGSPDGRQQFSAFYDYLVEKRHFGKKPCLMARSRGGLMLYSWAVENPDKVGGAIGLYPVCNVASYPGIRRASGAYKLTPEQLKTELAKHNPIDRLQALAAAKIPILHIHGDNDKVVPLEHNSALMRDRYQALGGNMRVIEIPKGGHDMSKHWFQSQPLTDFAIARALGQPLAE